MWNKFFRRRYKITVEDESHLTELTSRRVSGAGFWLTVVLFLMVCVVISGALIAFTPLRTLLPGYMKESQRSATEEGLLRLDSLMAVYDKNQAYIDNIMRVTDMKRAGGDSVSMQPTDRELIPDSLLQATIEEQRFVSQMEERERFNISVLAPLAADGIMFSPVSPNGVFSEDTRESEEGMLIMPRGDGVQAAADGSVIAQYYSPSERGYVVIVQHQRGFVTYYSHLGTPLVSVGDAVNAGQIISMAPQADAHGVCYVKVRMWHNGLAIVPAEYLDVPMRRTVPAGISYEAPRGKL